MGLRCLAQWQLGREVLVLTYFAGVHSFTAAWANKRVESRTGAVALVFRWLITRLSPCRLSPAWLGSVSCSRSSNRTGAFRAFGSRRKCHEVAHGKLTVRVRSWTSPSF